MVTVVKSGRDLNLTEGGSQSCVRPPGFASKGKDGKIYCNLCPSVLKNRRNAQVHYERLHAPRLVSYQCVICQKEIKSKPDFRVHINNTHNIKGNRLVEQYSREVRLVGPEILEFKLETTDQEDFSPDDESTNSAK